MDIEGLKKLAEAATPGPWVVYDADGSIGTIEDSAGAALAQAQMRGSLRNPNNIERKANTAFIAAANPQTVLALIAEVEHWKANHADMVARKALLEQRPDLPVDRIPAYREMERLQRELDRKDSTIRTISNALIYAEQEGAKHNSKAQELENENRRLKCELEEARKDALEEAAKICENWPLDAKNMGRAELYAKHGWGNAVSGTLRADVASAIRAAREKQGEQEKQSEKIVFDNPSYPMWLAQNREKQG